MTLEKQPMKPEDYIERNIKNFLDIADRSRRPTTSGLQRICRIGYSQAIHTLEEMERRGIVVADEPWSWKWA